MMNAKKTHAKPVAGALLLVWAAAAMSLFTAAPSFGRSHHQGIVRHYDHGYRDYSGYLNPRSGHYDPEFQRNRENFGFSGRDPSYPGGEDPSLHPRGGF
jgi:hypothetical protein